MNYSKIVLVLVVAAVFVLPFAAISSDSLRYEENTPPWTFDTYLSAATTTGTSSSVIVSHVYSPVSTYSCVITLGSATSDWVNIDLEGSIDGTNYFHIPVSAATISIGASTAALLSTATHTIITGKPSLYTKMTYSNRSGGATAVTSKCLAY